MDPVGVPDTGDRLGADGLAESARPGHVSARAARVLTPYRVPATLASMKASAVVLLLAVLLTACGGTSGHPSADPTTIAVTTPTPTEVASPTPSATPSTIAEIQSLFPHGYPRIVAVSSLPDQVRNWYQPDYTKAVAIAPGVWAPLSPGSSMFDAFSAGSFDGFCGSIKAYSRKYLHGADTAGTCW